MKKVFVFVVLFSMISGALFAQVAAGRQAWVSVKEAALKASTWFFAGTRGTLQMGSEVTVLRINGSWAEVRSAANQSLSGWTAVGNLSHRLIVAEGTTATAREVALAGKGFDRDVENAYKAEGNLNYDDVDRMEAITVSMEELLSFMTEGRLNTGEQQ